MPIEIYYAPTDTAKKISLQELSDLITAAGFPCTIELEDEAKSIYRLVLEPLESTLVVSLKTPPLFSSPSRPRCLTNQRWLISATTFSHRESTAGHR